MRNCIKYIVLSLFFLIFIYLFSNNIINNEIMLLSYNETSFLFDSSAVSYSNSNSSLSTNNVQTSIDELYEAIMGDCYVGYTKGTTTATNYTCNKKTPASSGTSEFDSGYVKYDNSNNSLVSTTVQTAIDELATHISYCNVNYHKTNETSSSYDCEADSFTITINAGAGISSVSGTEWTNTGTTSMTKSVQMGSTLTLCESTASATAIVGTINPGYSGCSSTLTTGSGTLNEDTYTVGPGSATITLTSIPNQYTLSYNDNLFAARTQTLNGLTAKYTENGSYLTLNGTSSATSVIPELWNLERRTINAGDQYKITISYVSGTMTRSDDTKNMRLVFELTVNGERFSDRGTDPDSYTTINFPTSSSGPTEVTFTVDSTRASANGLQLWLHEQGVGNATFTDYKVQILITPVRSSSTVTYDSTYGTLPTPTKTGYDFDGWYTEPTDGTQVTSSTTYTTVGDQTLYAHFTSHKLIIQYNANASNADLCETHGESYTLDSSKYVIYNSSRNVSTKSFGQTVDLLNYNNSTALCIARTGYSAPSGAQWAMNGNASKTYAHNGDIDINTMASDGECNLATTSSCTVRLNVNWTGNQYTVTYVDNLFVARTQNPNGVTATYTESGSHLTLNGITSTKWMVDELWNLERRTINADDKYKITIKYESGSYTRKVDSSQNPRFYFELTTDGEVFSDRTTSPTSYKLVEMPLSGENSATFTVDSTRASANGIRYRLYQQTASNFQFNDYKVQIIITKVHTKTVTYGSTYGSLDSTSKTGFTFNGWYTGLTDGSAKTSSTTYNTAGNQTLYAHWTYHKLHIRYKGPSATWCGSSSSSYEMDSSKYAVKKSDGSRDIANKGYGQYISHTSGFANYNSSSSICFSRSGYVAVSDKEWKLVNGDTTTYYSQTTSTYTAASVSTKAGCNLKTTDECTAVMQVNWTSSSSGGGDPTPAPTTTSTVCTDDMACGQYSNWCHYGSLCYYGAAGGTTAYDCQQNGGYWYCGSCHSSVANAACN